jgi:hypothetical protein
MHQGKCDRQNAWAFLIISLIEREVSDGCLP